MFSFTEAAGRQLSALNFRNTSKNPNLIWIAINLACWGHSRCGLALSLSALLHHQT